MFISRICPVLLVECWTSLHIGMIVFSTLFLILLAALPILIFLVLRRLAREGTLQTPNISRAFGCLFEVYAPSVPWWDAVILLRRLLMLLGSCACACACVFGCVCGCVSAYVTSVRGGRGRGVRGQTERQSTRIYHVPLAVYSKCVRRVCRGGMLYPT